MLDTCPIWRRVLVEARPKHGPMKPQVSRNTEGKSKSGNKRSCFRTNPMLTQDFSTSRNEGVTRTKGSEMACSPSKSTSDPQETHSTRGTHQSSPRSVPGGPALQPPPERGINASKARKQRRWTCKVVFRVAVMRFSVCVLRWFGGGLKVV